MKKKEQLRIFPFLHFQAPTALIPMGTARVPPLSRISKQNIDEMVEMIDLVTAEACGKSILYGSAKRNGRPINEGIDRAFLTI